MMDCCGAIALTCGASNWPSTATVATNISTARRTCCILHRIATPVDARAASVTSCIVTLYDSIFVHKWVLCCVCHNVFAEASLLWCVVCDGITQATKHPTYVGVLVRHILYPRCFAYCLCGAGGSIMPSRLTLRSASSSPSRVSSIVSIGARSVLFEPTGMLQSVRRKYSPEPLTV